MLRFFHFSVLAMCGMCSMCKDLAGTLSACLQICAFAFTSLHFMATASSNSNKQLRLQTNFQDHHRNLHCSIGYTRITSHTLLFDRSSTTSYTFSEHLNFDHRPRP